jgi:putative transposase
MDYTPNIHHRHSIRLKGYDYSKAGIYFITMCVQNRVCLFGIVENNQMILNDAGRMVEKWFVELPNKYPDIRCDEFVVMPNHFHCIIIKTDLTNTDHVMKMDAIIGMDATNNADVTNNADATNGRPHRGAPTWASNINASNINVSHTIVPITEQHVLSHYGPGNHKQGAPIGNVVGWFKTMITNEYIRGVKNHGWQPFNGKLWQRNYYEHIIRDEQSYLIISQYIQNNPANWNNDKFYN